MNESHRSIGLMNWIDWFVAVHELMLESFKYIVLVDIHTYGGLRGWTRPKLDVR